MNRPNLLFLTPTLPHTTGTGSAIRAGVTVEALARHFNVHVLHAELWGWHRASFHTDFVRRRAASYVYYTPEAGEIPMPSIMAAHFEGIRFQAVHAFRLIMARAAVAVMRQQQQPPPLAVIDLDDDEFHRSERFRALRVEAGEDARARIEQKELPQLRMMERVLVPRFQAICYAAAEDCERARERKLGPKLVHLPNAVFPPEAPFMDSKDRPPTLLFVGTLDYLPNEDGVQYFCKQILPLIQQRLLHPVRVRLVGANPREVVRNLSQQAGVEVLANVPELAPYYAEADAVIVPLRAGSGTRIKILEAFSFRKPVISTTSGAEGLPVTHGKQLLLADEAPVFAAHCVSLLEGAALRASLAESAWQWLLAEHSIDRVDQVIRSLYEPVLNGSSTGAALAGAELTRDTGV